MYLFRKTIIVFRNQIQIFITCMPVFNMHRELRNGKTFDMLAKNRMTGINSSENGDLQNAHRDNAYSDSEARVLTQEENYKQMKCYIVPCTRHLEELTWLIQGMSSAHLSNVSSRTSTSAHFR